MTTDFETAQTNARMGIRALPKLVNFVEKHKDEIVTMRASDDTRINMQNIDKTTVSMLINQIQHNLDICTKEHNKAVTKGESAKGKRKVLLSDKENHLMRPFYVSDAIKGFAKEVNFGVLSTEEFGALGRDVFMTLDPSDKAAMKDALSSVGSPNSASDYTVYETLKPFLQDANMINSYSISMLFYLYSVSNDVVGSDASRIKFTPAFMESFANQKVEWVVDGNKILDGFNIEEHRSDFNRLIEDGRELERKYKIVYKKTQKYLTDKDTKSETQKFKDYFEGYDVEKAKDQLRENKKRTDAIHKELNAIYLANFNGTSNNPVSVAECILAQGKTFLEVIKEFPSTDKFTSYVAEKDADSRGNWGCTYRTFSTFIKYIRIPNFIMLSRTNEETMASLESQEGMRDLKKRYDSLKSAYDYKKAAKEAAKKAAKAA